MTNHNVEQIFSYHTRHITPIAVDEEGIQTGLFPTDSVPTVIFVGTFSKILFPSLRLGYVVMPFSLVEQCKEWKRLADHHSNSINQLALTRFIENGDVERYIMKAKKLYLKRRNLLISLLNEYFPDKVKIHGAPAGMHIVAEFDSVIFSLDLIKRLKKAGINVIPVENHAIVKGKHTTQIILGYAHLIPSDLEQGIIKMKSILEGMS